MATRFRLPSSGSPPVTPAFQAGYTHANAVRRNMPTSTFGDASALTTTAQTPDSADHLVNGSTSHWQGTSAPLAAQTISAQTITLTMQGLEANAANNLFLALTINVFSADGTTQLGTIFAGGLDGTELLTSLRSRTMPVTSSAFTITSGNAGARLVVEISLSGTPTATSGIQGHNGSLRWGSNGAGGDLLADDTQTGTTLNGWLEFANTLTFASASGTLGSTLDAATCSGTGTVASSSITGTLDSTLGAATCSGVGVAPISGTLSTTLSAVTLAAAGSVGAGIEGVLSATLDPLSSTATGVIRTSGIASNTFGGMAAAGSGVAAIRGTVGSTFGPLALASTGKVAVNAALAKTLDALSSSGVGAVAGVGSLNASLAALSTSATGSVAIAGSLTQTFDALTVVASGGIPVPSQINIPLFARTGILLIGSEII